MTTVAPTSLLDYPSFHGLVADQAERFGDHCAFEVDRRRLSFGELEAEASEIAAGLAALGVSRGDRVGVLTFNCIEMIVLWVAASKLGALWCPLNHGLESEDLRYVLADLEPAVLVCDRDTGPKVAQLKLTGDAAPVDHTFVTGSEHIAGFRSYDELRNGRSADPVDVAHADPLMICYTGGTTGMPKGVIQPHGCFLSAGMRFGELFQPTPADVHFTMNQLFHQSTHHMSVTASLCWGATAVVDRWFSVSSFWPRVVESGATIIDPIATMTTMLVNQPECPEERQHRVRISWNASSTVPPEIPETFSRRFGIPLVATYGLTEGGGGHLARCRPDERERTRSNGKGGDWYEFRIADDEGAALPADELGEILVRPLKPNLMMTGYFRDPERTLETFKDLWLHTGDVGYLDAAGYLHMTGRKSHWIRRRGENVSSYEVEQALTAHPLVREVCVVGVPSELGDEDIKAFVLAQSDDFDPRDLTTWCTGRIAAFKIPRFVEVVDDLPRTSSKGEMDRNALRARPNDQAWDRERDG